MAPRTAKPAKKPRKNKDEPAPSWSLPAHQERSRGTRNRLLAAAERQFAENGYEATTIADIAKAAHSSVGAIYSRFKDKDALFNGVIEAFSEDASARVAELEVPDVAEDPARRVRRYIHHSLELFVAHKGLFRAIAERGYVNPQVYRPVLIMRSHLQRVLETSLLKGSRKKFRDAGLTVNVLTQMINGFLTSTVMNPIAPTRGDVDRAVEELADVVIEYLGLGDQKYNI